MRRALSVIGFNDTEVEVRFSSTHFPTFKDFFCFDLGFLIEINHSNQSECIPHKNPKKIYTLLS